MGTIELSGLKIGYPSRKGQTKQIGPEIILDALEGELIALIGRNGIGKSTLLRTIANLQKPLDGSLKIRNKLFKEIDRNEYSTLLSFVSTEPVRIPNLTVYQLVALGRFPYTNWYGTLTSIDKELIAESITLTGLNNLVSKPVNEISDGERQRAMIARALAQNTPIIILDEPTAYLDLVNKYDIVHILQDLAHSKQKTIVFSTHDLNIALSETDKIWLMNNIEALQGAPEDLILKNSFIDLFENKLEFNWESGTFKKLRYHSKTLSLKGDQGIFFNLILKAIERIGFTVVENANNIVMINNNDKTTSLISDRFSETKNFTSIYELCRLLNSIT